MDYRLLFFVSIFLTCAAIASNYTENLNSQLIEMAPSEHSEEEKLLEIIHNQCIQLTHHYHSEPKPPITLHSFIEFFEYNNERLNIFEIIKKSFEFPIFTRSGYIASKIRSAKLPPASLKNIILNLQEGIQHTKKRNL